MRVFNLFLRIPLACLATAPTGPEKSQVAIVLFLQDTKRVGFLGDGAAGACGVRLRVAKPRQDNLIVLIDDEQILGA